MKRISFRILSDQLCLKDSRSIRSWCKRHGINAFKDGKSWYVYEDEFIEATSREFVMPAPEGSYSPSMKLNRYAPDTEEAKAFEKRFSHLPGR